MRKYILIISLIVVSNAFSQDSMKTKIDNVTKVQNEIGANTTLLLKQIFNLSNNSFPTLPYDLTYKLIKNKSALRVGFGVTVNNSSVTTTTSTSTTSNSTVPPPGPDAAVPTFNKSSNYYYRIGWERRYMIGKKMCASWGVDFAGQYGTSHSQSSQTFDNLPNGYSYTKSTDDLKLMSYGGGPEVGIQIFINKYLSVYTELPVYFQLTQQQEVTDSYQNQLTQTFPTNVYTSSDSKQTQTTTGTKFSVILPVTLYLAVKF